MNGPGVPPALRGPVDVALSRAQDTIPGPHALPGGARYEPKWDGFRMVVVRDTHGCRLWSRQGTDLTSRFPELVAAAVAQVPDGTVLDGEAVVWAGDRLSFTDMARRMSGSPATIAAAARARPASYAAFDVLAVDGTDVRDQPWAVRRAHLEHLAGLWVPPLNLTPVTDDPQVAAGWFDALAVAGVEGLVVKGAGQRYRAGARDWVKVKRRAALDVVCAAVLGPVHAPSVVVAGLPVDGRLRIVGRTVTLSAAARKALVPHLDPAAGEHPWPAQVAASSVHGFAARAGQVELTLVTPVVVEVAADVAWSGRSFRHPLRFLRARTDIDPRHVSAPQL